MTLSDPNRLLRAFGLARLAVAAKLSPEEFRRQFAPLVLREPGPMSLHRISTFPSVTAS